MLKLVKKCSKVDGKWLWQIDQNEETFDIFDIPKKTYLIFGIFVLDIFIKDIEPTLQSLYNKISERLKEWNSVYPWSEYNGVSLRFDNISNIKYILGELCVEDNLKIEESLIVSILRKFSKDVGDQVFIKIVDTDGDFLLASCYDVIPGNYEYPVGNNRLWLRNGNFIIIPDTIQPNKGLDPKTCLDTLLFSPFKCISIDNISKKLDKLYPTEDFPTKQFSELGLLSLELPDNKISEILKSNPQIINYLIKNLFTINTNDKKIIDDNYMENLEYDGNVSKFLISKNHFNLLLLYLGINKLKVKQPNTAKECGFHLLRCLHYLIDSGDIEVENVEDKSLISLDGAKWMDVPLYRSYKFPELDYNQKYEIEEGIEPNEKLMDLFTQFFNEKDASKEVYKDFEKDDQSDSGVNANNARDEDDEREAREYLKNENSGITEDDFFEFFLKEALKMKDTDLEQFRKEDELDSDVMDSQSHEENISEIELGLDEENFNREIKDVLDDCHSKKTAVEAFEDMFNSLNIDGVVHGPFESMLRHLANNSGEF